jgi:hypothetical protein
MAFLVLSRLRLLTFITLFACLTLRLLYVSHRNVHISGLITDDGIAITNEDVEKERKLREEFLKDYVEFGKYVPPVLLRGNIPRVYERFLIQSKS